MNKKHFGFLLLLFLALPLTACGRNTPPNDITEPPTTATIAHITTTPAETAPHTPQPFRGFTNAAPYFNTSADFGTSQFPAVHITTDYPAINRHTRIPGTISVSNTDASFTLPDTPMRIRGRGNSSWELDKKPFRIRFPYPVALLDAGHAARDWTFIANHSDKTLMRNYSAYYLAGLLDGMSYAPFARFVDVYFNGEYQGVYMLCIQVSEVREGRVDLTYSANPAQSEYLLELNRRITYNPDNIEGVHFLRIGGRYYHIRFPAGDDLTSAHVDYLRDYLTRLDDLIYTRNPRALNYIHVPSFIDYYLVQELYKNYDISSLSVFMQIRGQGSDRRLEKGPVWDFDISAGNCYYQDRNNHRGGYGPTGIWAGYMNRWFRGLMDMPGFASQTATRWAHIYENELPQTIARIEYMAAEYGASFERNFARWPIMGVYVWPNPQEVVGIDTFAGQVDYLIDFLQVRGAWLRINL
ncbi:MAG: CotH kinase family protein [Defluviitaleaceae bacterium]|nr:CotH kinase family protein [Defluviitaleaceae bacterium]